VDNTPFAGRWIKLAAETRVLVKGEERPAQLTALSPSGAVVRLAAELGQAGEVLEVSIPLAPGLDLKLTAGVDGSQHVADGWLVAVSFMFGEAAERKALDELIMRLLGGSGGGRREHPRITYRVPVRFGPADSQEVELIELSMSGCLLHARESLAVGTLLKLHVPSASGHGHLRLDGEARHQQPLADPKGWFSVGVAWKPMGDEQRAELSMLLRALLSRAG
jgi:hypothetical protein